MDEIFLPVNSIVCAAANQDRNLTGASQRSRSAVLTKRIAASGYENDFRGNNSISPESLPATKPLTKEPEDSGYEIGARVV